MSVSVDSCVTAGGKDSEDDDDDDNDSDSDDADDGGDAVTKKKQREPSGKRKATQEKPAKKKAKKDKNAPKGARSAYAIFVQQTRAELKAANPSASFGELAKLGADNWKALAPEEKAKFESLANDDKKR